MFNLFYFRSNLGIRIAKANYKFIKSWLKWTGKGVSLTSQSIIVGKRIGTKHTIQFETGDSLVTDELTVIPLPKEVHPEDCQCEICRAHPKDCQCEICQDIREGRNTC